MTSHEEKVRARAQQLWEQAGKPQFRDEEFWHEAERQIRTEEQDQRPDPMQPPRGRPN